MSIKRHLEKYLNERRAKVDRENLQRYSQWALSKGYSSKYEHQLHWGLKHYVYYLEQVHGVGIELYLPRLCADSAVRPALDIEELKRVSSWLLQIHKDYWLRQSLWALFYGGGLRRSEALGLQLQDLKVKERQLKIRTSKSGKTRLIPISDRQLKSITEYILLERPSPQLGFESVLILGRRGGKADSLIGKELVVWQEGTGLGPKFTWHALRHSIATELVQQGMSIEQVSQFLGHENVSSTSRYLHAENYHKTTKKGQQ